MQVVQARATFVTPETFDESLTTIVARSVLEAALQDEDSAELWFELGDDSSGEDVSRLSIDLSHTDIEELLRLTPDDEIALTLDGAAVESMFDPDVEAHGLKGAIAIAVTSAAILAPAAQAGVAAVRGRRRDAAGDDPGHDADRRCRDDADLGGLAGAGGERPVEAAGGEDPGCEGQRTQASPKRTTRAVAAQLPGGGCGAAASRVPARPETSR